jgi:glycosyltransferase involved in cell wall biosynthesis
MKILVGYGSKGKFFHLKEFCDELEKQNITVKLVRDTDYSRGFPSKRISDWISGDKKFKMLIREFKPDLIFTDRQTHFAIHSIKSGIPTFVLLRGHYWEEYVWAIRTLGKNIKTRITIWFKNKVSERVFREATVILPICKYLEDVVKEHHPQQKTGVFLEGINSERWHHTKKMELNHPCVGLVQDANWWGKTKEMLLLEDVLKKMPDVHFYWAGDGQFRRNITEKLEKYDNFTWLGRLDYPDKIREFLETLDVYALITGMDLAPLTLKEAQLMEKPVIATDVGGDKEMMIENKTGFLVKEGDSADIVEKITKLLVDEELSKRMGMEGTRFVRDEFNWKKVTENFLDIIKPYLKN